MWKQDLHNRKLIAHFKARTRDAFCYVRLTGQRPIGQTKENNRACSNGLHFPIRTRTQSISRSEIQQRTGASLKFYFIDKRTPPHVRIC